jgi:hypothetical protein
MMEEQRPADDGCSDQTVEDDGAGEVGAKPVAANVVFVAELEVSCYGTLTFRAAA